MTPPYCSFLLIFIQPNFLILPLPISAFSLSFCILTFMFCFFVLVVADPNFVFHSYPIPSHLYSIHTVCRLYTYTFPQPAHSQGACLRRTRTVPLGTRAPRAPADRGWRLKSSAFPPLTQRRQAGEQEAGAVTRGNWVRAPPP